MIDEAIVAAQEIGDPDDRARAFARLSRDVSGQRAIDLWVATLETAASIPDHDSRAETFQMLAPYVPDDPITTGLWKASIDNLPNRQLQARADNLLGLLFLQRPPESLAAKISTNPQVWAPVMLSAVLHNVLARFQGKRTTQGVWSALQDRPTDKKLVADLLDKFAEDGIPLTRDAAEAVNALIDAAEEESIKLLLPLFQNPSPNAVSQVERWMASPDKNVAHHAALFLAEDGRKINERTLPGLVAFSQELPIGHDVGPN